eukprot:2494096-Rhodomonas_salina.3
MEENLRVSRLWPRSRVQGLTWLQSLRLAASESQSQSQPWPDSSLILSPRADGGQVVRLSHSESLRVGLTLRLAF